MLELKETRSHLFHQKLRYSAFRQVTEHQESALYPNTTAAIQFQPLFSLGHVGPLLPVLSFLKRNRKSRFKCEVPQFLKQAGQTRYIQRLGMAKGL